MEVEVEHAVDEGEVAAHVEDLAEKWITGDPNRRELWASSHLFIAYRRLSSRDHRFPSNCLMMLPEGVAGVAKKRRKTRVALAFADRSRCFTRIRLLGTIPVGDLEERRSVSVEGVTLDASPPDEPVLVPSRDHHPPRDRHLLERVSLKEVALERLEELALPCDGRKAVPMWMKLLGRHLLAICLCRDSEAYVELIEAEIAGATEGDKRGIVEFFERAKTCYADQPLSPAMTELRQEILRSKKVHFGTTKSMQPR